MTTRLDRNALRFNQASIVAFTILAFVVGDPAGRWLLLAVAAVMGVGTVYAPFSAFKLLYRHVLVRRGVLKPEMVVDDPAPHQFAQGMGSVFLFGAFVALVAGVPLLGWVLAWIVVGLAGLNLLLGFCLGCFLYFQLGRIGVLPRAQGAG